MWGLGVAEADITNFGTASDGQAVQHITLRAGGLTVSVLTWGAVVQDVRLAGADWPLTLGSPDLAAYEGPMEYFGAVVGPVANRIGGARAEIGGRLCRFPANEGKTLLHGGKRGTQVRHWDVVAAGVDFVTLRLALAGGDQGFPGNRVITASYRVTAPASLTLELTATSDAETLMNLANHSYWNLDGTGVMAGHRLRVAADTYTPAREGLLPTGERRAVHDAFDLRAGRVIDGTEGYDHNFCLADGVRPLTGVAELTGRAGVRLRIATTEPGFQVYDGAFLNIPDHPGHGGVCYSRHQGMALEAQHWPDTPNQCGFPPITLAPGATYRQKTRWCFSRR